MATETPEAPAATATTTKAPAAPKKEKAPLPEGYVTPVTFAKTAGPVVDGAPSAIRPQIVYGYIKNSSKDHPFPCKQNTDGAWIVNAKDAATWLAGKETRKAERDAAKAVKDAAKTAKAAEPAAEAAKASK